MSTEVEREHKLLADDDFVVPTFDDLDLQVAEPVDADLFATYYDTTDLRLARVGASLRWRDDELCWAVKLPRGTVDETMSVRDTFAFPGSPSAPSADALDLITALVRRAPVLAVAHVRTRRSVRWVSSPSGAPIAEIDDDRVEADTNAGRACFRELEVELLGEAPAPLAAAISRRLRDAGARPSDELPKVVRALGERARRPPDVVVHRLRKSASGADVVRHAFADEVARLIRHDPGVRVGDDHEDVHQARVATRRLRSHLRTFAPLVEEGWAGALAVDLRWLGGALGDVRDLEVLRLRLVAHTADLPARDAALVHELIAELDRQWAAARARLLDALRSTRYVELLDRLVDAADRPRVTSVAFADARDLRKIVRRPARRLHRAMRDVDEDAPDANLHAARIRAKRARYAAEAVEGVYKAAARRYAEAVTALQDVLGEHQDAIVAQEWLRDVAERLPGPVAYAAGELSGRERQAAHDARSDVAAAWDRARRRKLRAWLR